MRKFLIGCGIALLVVLMAGGAAAWWFLGRPIAAVAGAVRDMQRIENTYDDVRDQSRYVPPDDGVLSENQVQRWVQVQSIMQAGLTDTAEQLRARYQELDERYQDPTPAELASIVRDSASLVADAARTHVRALNETGFSVEEYRWVRNQVLQAAGHALAGYDLTQIAAAAGEEGRSLPDEPAGAAPPPPVNVERVEPYLDRIEEALVFAWFGL